MQRLSEGATVDFHTKVNIDPLGSHCALCGRKTDAKLWFPVGWDAKVNRTDADPANTFSEAIWGWWPVGSECAKRFDAGTVVERN